MITVKRKAFVFLTVLILTLLTVCSALADYVVNTSWLKAHEKPSYSSKVVDSYRRDFAVTILHKYEGGWVNVRFLPSGNRAYVQSKYLKKASSYTAYIIKDKTNVRTGPATSFQSLGQMNMGAELTVLAHGANFDYCATPKGRGYILNSCLSKSKPVGTTAFIKNPRNKTVNLRQGPGKQYKVIAEYRPGTRITLLHTGKAWCKVSVKGRTGYMMRKYILVE